MLACRMVVDTNCTLNKMIIGRQLQDIMKSAPIENWLHPQASVHRLTLLNGWIQIINPNGFFAKFEHDIFFDNRIPFDHDQIVVLVCVTFPFWELTKIIAAEMMRGVKSYGYFQSTHVFAGYIV